MTVDVDAVNERLNGLVNLLHVVGLDGVDPGTLQSDQNDKDGAVPQSNDAQILEIIRKLQQAQADSPEILAALKSPELRALASLAASRPVAKAAEPEKKAAAPSLGDVMDDDDDNYPKIGPGYSDDISVVSDLTTPTVMTKQHVQEEEYYKDVNGGPGALPPMNIALGPGPANPARPNPGLPRALVAPPKTKNLVSQVRPAATRRAIAKSGGAAAQRRLNYQQAMAKLQSTDTAAKPEKSGMDSFTPQKPNKFVPAAPTPTGDPSEFPSIAEFGKKNSKAPKKTAVPQAKARGNSKKTSLASQEGDASFSDMGTSAKKKSSSNDLDWGSVGSGNGGGWPAFDDKSTTKKKKEKSGFDDNGFFSGDAFANSDPFATTSKSPSKKTSSDPFNVGGDSGGSTSGKTSRHKREEKSSDRKGSKSKSSKSKSRPRTNLAM